MTESQSASVCSVASFSMAMPALLMSTLTGPKRGFGGVDGLADRSHVSHVHLHRRGAAALPDNFVLESLQFGGLPRSQSHGRALLRKHPRELTAQPLGRSGD